jgi:hypothetical protein
VTGEGFDPTGTPEPTPTPTATPTPDPGTPVSSPTPDGTAEEPIVVTNATLAESEAAPGEIVLVNATIENRGTGNTIYTAGLSVDGTVVATEPVTLPAGAQGSVSFRYEVNASGTVPVAVNGTRAGTLTIGGGGLVASIVGLFDPVVGLLGALPLGLVRPLVVFLLVPAIVIYAILKGLAIYLGY